MKIIFNNLYTRLHSRAIPDMGVNDLINKLLSLCKNTGLRISNGCHNLGNDKDYTSVGPNGMSVVDYVIHVTTPDVFLKMNSSLYHILLTMCIFKSDWSLRNKLFNCA